MKKLILLVSMVFIATSAYAESRAFETSSQANARHAAENYNTYGNKQPLGGYNQKLGDPSPLVTNNPVNRPATPSNSFNSGANVPRYSGPRVNNN